MANKTVIRYLPSFTHLPATSIGLVYKEVGRKYFVTSQGRNIFCSQLAQKLSYRVELYFFFNTIIKGGWVDGTEQGMENLTYQRHFYLTIVFHHKKD